MAINLVPSETEWTEWREHPVTRAWLAMLARLREEIKEQWAQGTLHHPLDQTAAVAAISRAQLYQQLAETNYAEFITNLSGDATERDLTVAESGDGDEELVDLPRAG